jgi:hypothetical protein
LNASDEGTGDRLIGAGVTNLPWREHKGGIVFNRTFHH